MCLAPGVRGSIFLKMPNTSQEAVNSNNLPLEFNFSKQSQIIRTKIKNGEPWFVAKDICDALEISNSRDAISSLENDEKGVDTADTPGGVQSVQFVNESGLYNLIFQSRKPEAKKFRKWVTNEVLPSIRKTGKYGSTINRANLITNVAAIEEILQYAETMQHEGETWYAGAQMVVLLGKSTNGGTAKTLKNLSESGEAKKMAGGRSMQVKWYIKKQAIGKLFKLKPNNTANMAFIKSLKEGGLL